MVSHNTNSIANIHLLLFLHITHKKSGANTIRKITLYIPEEREQRKRHKILALDCTIIEMKCLQNLMVFSSASVKAALNQHKGLERAIICDVYEVMLLPEATVINNLSTNALKLFGQNLH
jgi:hypothetical protein